MAVQDKRPLPKTALVLGGGVSGLITLRNLILHGSFDRIELVERRKDIGGVWFLEPQEPGAPDLQWQSPAYPNLIGNVLPEFLSFSSAPPFPQAESAPTQPFPSLTETYDYLQRFAKPFLEDGRIRCDSEVVKVDETVDGKWDVYIKAAGQPEAQHETWDSVVVCTGWHSTPWWPDTEGLSLLRDSGLAFHASDWKGVEHHKLHGKKVLVLGNAASGNDIAAQLAGAAVGPGFIFRSIRRPAFPGFPSLPDEKIHDVKPVRKYSAPEAHSTKFSAELMDGTIIDDLDLVIPATGYRANPDYLNVRSTVASPAGGDSLHNLMQDPPPDPYRIPSLHEHIIYAPNPSLAFIGCIMSFTPFTTADLSSAWLALAFTGELSYPSTIEGRLQWEKDRVEATQKTKEEFSKDGDPTNYISYNVLGYGEQAFAERLRKEIEEAGDKGKQVAATLPLWNDQNTKERERMYDVKLEVLVKEKEKDGARR